MPLTLTLRAGLAISRLVFGPSIIQPLEKGRARLRWITWRPYELIPVKRVVDQIIAGPGGDLVVRIDEPDGTAPCPLLLFFHGGGFVMGDLDAEDRLCRVFCRDVPCVVRPAGSAVHAPRVRWRS